MKIITNIKNCSIYFSVLGAVFVLIGIILSIWTKAEIHLFLNQFHSPVFDNLFISITYAGTGISLGIAIFFFLFIKYKHAIALLFGYCISIGVVVLFKQVLLSSVYRPVRFFEELGIEIYTIDGLSTKTLKSFPSGHTTEIFCVITFIVLIIGNKTTNLLWLFAALLVGYSRVYLSQHFLQDVLGGAVLGTLCALIGYTTFQRMSGKNEWMEKSILTH